MPAPSAPTDFAVAEAAVLYAFVNAGTFKLSNKAAVLLTWTNNAPSTAQHRVEWSADGTTWKLGEAATYTADAGVIGYWGTQFQAVVGSSIAGVGKSSLLVVNLPLNATLHFRIKAQADGDSGYATLDHTTGALATTGAPPTSPGSFAAASPTSREIALTWEDQSANEAYFEIEAQMDTDHGRTVNSWYVDGTREAITIDVQARFGSYFYGASVASRFVDVLIRSVGGSGTASKYPSVVSPWSDFTTVQMAAPAIFVTYPSATTISAEKGAVFSLTILTNTPATTWSVDTLPAGLMLADNVISGTPTTAGSTVTTITVGDGTTTGTKIVTFSVATSSLQFTSLSDVKGKLGAVFSYQVRARILSGSIIPITYAAADLPSFLSINGSGVITGTPTDDGEFTFVVTATTARATNSMTVKLTVAALDIETPEELRAAIGQEFRLVLVSSPAGADFELIGGADWLEIEDNTLVGTPPDNTLDQEFAFDLAATIGTSTTTKSVAMTVGKLFEINDPIEGATGRHILEYVKYLGAGTVTDMWLSNQPAGLDLWDFSDGGYSGVTTGANLRAIRGAPTQAGLFKPTVSAQIIRYGKFEAYAVDFSMLIKGGLFLPWFHNDAYRMDLQVPLRGDVSRRAVRSYYETAGSAASTSTTTTGDTTTVTKTDAVSANLLTLKRGDKAALGIIFRDGVDTTVASITDVKLTFREKDAEDGEYVFEVFGAPATLSGYGYFAVEFAVDAEQLTDAFGDDSITSIGLLGEICFKHGGDPRSSASFPVTIVEDIER